jgi:hypothetical protein
MPRASVPNTNRISHGVVGNSLWLLATAGLNAAHILAKHHAAVSRPVDDIRHRERRFENGYLIGICRYPMLAQYLQGLNGFTSVFNLADLDELCQGVGETTSLVPQVARQLAQAWQMRGFRLWLKTKSAKRI